MKIKTVLILALLANMFVLSGCNTITGVGKDIQCVGTTVKCATGWCCR